MHAVLAIAMKDLRLLFRDRAGAFFTLVFPLLVAVFFGTIFNTSSGGGGKMSIAVVNEDGGAAAGAFAADLAKDDALSVKPAANRAEGESLVRAAKVVACVVIPKGFDSSAIFAGRPMKIEGIVDPSHQAEAGLLTGKLNEIGFRQMSRAFGDPKAMSAMTDNARTAVRGWFGGDEERRKSLLNLFDDVDRVTKQQEAARESTPAAGSAGAGSAAASTAADPGPSSWRPVDVSVHELAVSHAGEPHNAYEISFPQGVVWGLMGCVTGFAASLASERTRGTLMRLTTAPLSRGQVLLGKAVACFLACIIVQVMLLVIAVIGFKVHIGNPPMMAATVLIASFGFVGLMMAVAGLTRTEGGAGGAGRAVLLVLAMIGGGSIPISFMPELMRKFTVISPFTWATQAVEGAMWRGLTLEQMLLPWGVLGAFGVGGYVVGSSAFKWTSAA